MFKDKITTRQYLMAGIVIVFVLTLILGNYGVYTHIAHQRYIVKEELMDDIGENVDKLGQFIKESDACMAVYEKWITLQLSNTQGRSIIEDYHMAEMAFDENIERTYNMNHLDDEIGMLMVYDGILKNMAADLRIEVNRLFEGYETQRFLLTTLTPNAKIVLNSSYGYTALLPYDANIDGKNRKELVAYYEHFNQLSTQDLNQWKIESIPDDDALYIAKTIALKGAVSDRYLLTYMLPIDEMVDVLHTFSKNYTFHVFDQEKQLIVKGFESVDKTQERSLAVIEGDLQTWLDDDQSYPFVKKAKSDYIIGHPIKDTPWNALAVFDESAIGKNTLLKTSGFYLLNLLFIGIFSFLVVAVNRHLEEQ